MYDGASDERARGPDFRLSSTVPMSTADKISDMKCWAISMLIHAILSGNLAIFIIDD